MINLIPPELKQTRIYGRRNRTLVSYCISVIVVGILTISIAMFNMQYSKADINRLNDEMKQRESEASKLEQGQKQIDAVAAQLKTIDKLYSGEVRFSELIPQIGGLLPSGMVLNSLSLAGGKSNPLQLEVDMETQNLAAVFQQNLVHSDLFDAADISVITSKGSATPKPGQKTYNYSATLTATFKGAAIKATGAAK